MTEKWSPCRPDETHWCVACCTNHGGCPRLVTFTDGKMGCEDYYIVRHVCHDADCTTFYTFSIQEIMEKIKKLPSGKFDMWDVLIELASEYREKHSYHSQC
ncbi:hypothetical protein GYA49_05715 [Candidatus Beckwithbacteria bacterium]|nr:hypothetical protein [Candidatus Beckwithbacteria bacterium]